MASSAGSSTGLSVVWTTMSIPPSLVQQIVDVVSLGFSRGRKSSGSTSSTQQVGWITFHNTIFCSGCWGRSPRSLVLILQCIWLLVVRSLIPFSAQWTGTQSFVVPLLLFDFAPIQFYYYCWPCRFLHQRSVLVSPALCLRNCWVRTQLLPLFQFCINLLLWALAFPRVPRKSWARSSLGSSSS